MITAEREAILLALLEEPVVTYGEEKPTDEEICFLLQKLATGRYKPIALDLDMAPLSQKALQYLDTAFSVCPSLIFVNLSFCDLDDKKFKVFSKSLEELPLIGVDLSHNNISQRAIDVLCSMMKRKHLLHLNLNGNKKVGYSCGQSLQEIFSKNSSLLYLGIIDTSITTFPEDRLSEAFRSGELDVWAKLKKEIKNAITRNQKLFQERVRDPKELLSIVIPEALASFLKTKTDREASLEDTPLLFIAEKQKELQQPVMTPPFGFTPLSIAKKASDKQVDERKEPEIDMVKSAASQMPIQPQPVISTTQKK